MPKRKTSSAAAADVPQSDNKVARTASETDPTAPKPSEVMPPPKPVVTTAPASSTSQQSAIQNDKRVLPTTAATRTKTIPPPTSSTGGNAKMAHPPVVSFPPLPTSMTRIATLAAATEFSQQSHETTYSTASAFGNYAATNAVDEVIDEVNHLLQAAAEAQALGRLRNSYSCLLLAHQRLVGVGRRVDRSYCEAEDDEDVAATVASSKANKGCEASNLSMESQQPQFLPPIVSQPPLPPTLTQNYSDVAYVEHLARSAMELHHKRTGRGMQHEAAAERQANAARMKRMEEEQIREAAAGVFALATGVGGDDKDMTPTKRKGGRGKKPPTLVMHTMAGRNYDVKNLMRGIV